ncbi:MAG: MBL fold metallo-hydrolase [Candidatus Cloacimonadota bacterium]|nr:MAG: MBL fold metallo-hydrolase [Candidatus Cloacimonadota bacterium]
MKSKIFVLLPGFETNTILVWDEKSREAMLIDPSLESDRIINFVDYNKLKIKYIVNTHGHGDHIGGNRFFKEKYNAPLLIHKNDAHMLPDNNKNMSALMGFELDSPSADTELQGGEELSLGDEKYKILHTPGHSKGSICILHKNHLFAGDTLFRRGMGRTDLPGGSYDEIIYSIKNILFKLDPKTVVYPGHGPTTTIGDEAGGIF